MLSQQPQDIDPHAIRIMQIFDEAKRVAGEGDTTFLIWLWGRKGKRLDTSMLSRYRTGHRAISLRCVRDMIEYLATDPECERHARAIVEYAQEVLMPGSVAMPSVGLSESSCPPVSA